ncbi:MAG: AEC family transporter [Syntrophomonadaceae bacterium]|nr:AEC family transporter [Syntrophomonadaceae bacterium]
MNNVFIITLVMVCLGYLLKRLDIFSEKDGETIAKIVFNLTLPALFFSNFSQAELELSLIWLSVIAIAFNLFIIAIGMFVYRREERKRKGMYVIMLPVGNGLFFFPLVEAIWGSTGLIHFGMFDIANAFTLYVISYFIASYYSAGKGKADFKYIGSRMLRSAPLMTYVVVILINLLGINLPELFLQATRTIAQANMPLTFLMLGIYMEFRFDKNQLKDITKVIGIRYVTGLIVGVALLYILPFSSLFKYIVLCSLLLPTPAVLIPYALEFQYNVKFVAAVSNITVVLSFFLLWIIVGILPPVVL